MDVTKSIFEGLDWFVLGLYFAILVGVAVWVALQRNKNTEDYFLAGRNVGWFVIGASIFASNIGSEHVVGLAGTGFSSGTPLAHYELHAWIVLLLGWLFLPFYIRSGAFTMPEFLEKRFDSRSRWFLSVFSLFAYVLTKVSVTIYAGGIVVSELLNLDFWVGAIGIVVFTGIYTIIGGLKAVVYTETLQTIVSRSRDPNDKLVVSVTQIHAGSTDNVTPQNAYINGTVRTFDKKVQELVIKRMEEIVSGHAQSFGLECKLRYEKGYPPTINSPENVKTAALAAEDISGVNMVDDNAGQEMGAEDFSYLLEKRPGAYLFLGIGEAAGLHNTNYDFNDDASVYGASFFARLVEMSQPLGR